MKLNILLLVTHGAAAGVAGGCVAIALLFGFTWAWIGVVLLLAISVLATAWLSAWKIRRGIKSLDRALAKRSSEQDSGIYEFDRAAVRLCEYAQRWDEVTASGKEQSREVESLLRILDRRSAGKSLAVSGPASFQLRQLLAGIGGALHNNLTQMVQAIDEIGRCSHDIAAGAESQSYCVGKASTCVEQITANVNSVAGNAETARACFANMRGLADDTMKDVRELIRAMDRIRARTESSEKKLRALGDHSHEISSLVETIAEIASRTDMLALNASIESVRAGEHGKGFAVVAEEVRKLAEQATQATREAAGLVETIRLETQESINGISQERAQVETEVARVCAAGEAMDKLGQLTDESVARVHEILNTTLLQTRLVDEVASSVDQISGVASTSRKRSERACWVINSLTKNTRAFGASLTPLRRCSDGYVEPLESDSADAFPLSIEAGEPDDGREQPQDFDSPQRRGYEISPELPVEAGGHGLEAADVHGENLVDVS